MYYTVICCFSVLLFVLSAHGLTEITHPKIKPVYVATGGTLELICEHDDAYSLQWSRATIIRSNTDSSSRTNEDVYKLLDTSSVTGFYMTSLVRDGRGWTNLTKYNVTLADAGSYKCSMISKPDRSYAVDVNVLQVDEISNTVSRPGVNSIIGCAINCFDRIRVNVSWFKDGERIIDDNGLHYSIIQNQSDVITTTLLNITRVGDYDIGPYQCRLTLINGITLTQTVNLYAAPQVRHMSRSHNIVAGQTLRLKCSVWGWPIPVVYWQRVRTTASNSTQLNLSDWRISFESNVAVAPAGYVVKNATLVITDVTYNDRDVYMCNITSSFNNRTRVHNATVLVRVKGKFAPVWPLLGIVAEAVILCVIIVVHEGNRKRQRRDNENKENDNHLENSSCAQSTHATVDTVRHRK